MRRATPRSSAWRTAWANFYPRSPCGERPDPFRLVGQCRDFYPRSPCGERRFALRVCVAFAQFLSTLSLRRATLQRWAQRNIVTVFLSTLSLRRATNRAFAQPMRAQFLSTLSLRRATSCNANVNFTTCISIHALLAESDFPAMQMLISQLVFLSTLSLRRATRPQPPKARVLKNFYPRSPCGERPKKSPLMCFTRHFYPRSPCGERQ